jgi:hypothetical protein
LIEIVYVYSVVNLRYQQDKDSKWSHCTKEKAGGARVY